MASSILSPSQARQSGEASGTRRKYGHCEQDRCAVFLEELVAVAITAGGPHGHELMHRMRDICRLFTTRVGDSILMAHISSTLLVRIMLDMKGLNPAKRRIVASNIERVAAGLHYINDDLNQEAAELVLEESFYLIPVILRSRWRNNGAGWKALVAEIVH